MPRNSRYHDIIPERLLLTTPFHIIGCGAIGSQVATTLAHMGAAHLTLWDPDCVEEHNLGCQSYTPDDLEHPKVRALARRLLAIQPECDITTKRRPCYGQIPITNTPSTAFLCVDTMAARREITTHLPSTTFLIDGRMSGLTFRIVATPMSSGPARYHDTLCTDEEAYGGNCTQRSLFYAANITASMMVHQWSLHARGITHPFDITGGLLDYSLTTHYHIGEDTDAPC